jgi:ABC-type branched-chain amino acid transport systems, periplasmic component
MAALDPVAESQTPMITLIGSASVVEPQEGKKVWAYKMAQTDSAMADVMTRYMSNHNVKTVGFIGFADGYGESWLNEFSKFAALRIFSWSPPSATTAPTPASPARSSS